MRSPSEAASSRRMPIRTGWPRAARTSSTRSWPEDPEFLAEIPAGRYATTEEIGKLARFLVSDDAAYINGESIRIDGGAARSL
ncbi:SDR family oxidoreductase [Streptomyces sp. ISL-66]|uniref:SDR family oxidoreductase n=1 Tax=Streptomyces sp. ISL-66 TaxID=2819186 RepID=UPI0027E3F5D9|nr:SDR family oxidoreductase [Streptomyces sp. ISL-66]